MNLKFLSSKLRYSIVMMVVGLLFTVGGCKKDSEPAPTMTIYEILAANPDLSELTGYLDAFSDLKALVNTVGATEFTMFAPNNAAFQSLYATPGFPADPADISPDLIKGVVAYHIVAGKYLSSNLVAGTEVATLYDDTNSCTGAKTNQTIKVNDDGTLLTGSSNDKIAIVTADDKATNGVVHVVGSVLIPPSVGQVLTPILGKLVATVLLGADFKYLAKAMTIADCGVSGVTPLSNILAGPGPYTAFLPPDLVFEGTAAASSKTVDQFIAQFTAEQWRAIILNHIVAGSKNLASLTDETTLTTLLGTSVKLTVSDVAVSEQTPTGKVLTTSGGTSGLGGTTGSPILVADQGASNGIAHVVGKILIPN